MALNAPPSSPAAVAALFGAAGALGVKSESLVLLDNASINGLSHQVLDMRAYNAVHAEITVSGTGVSATLTIEGASAPGGPYQVLATSVATLTVTGTTAINVPCGALFVKARLAGVTGVFPAGGGITVRVNGYLSGSFTDVTLVGPTITASTNINQVNGAALSLGNPLPVELSDGASALGTVGNPLHTAPPALGQQPSAASAPVVIASDQSALPVSRGYTADSLPAYGSVTSPGIGAAIATRAAPGAGVYEIQAQAGFLGTVAAGDVDNMELRHGAVVVGKLPCSPVANTFGPLVTFPRITVGAGETLTINATAAGQAGSVYRGLLVVTRVA